MGRYGKNDPIIVIDKSDCGQGNKTRKFNKNVIKILNFIQYNYKETIKII